MKKFLAAAAACMGLVAGAADAASILTQIVNFAGTADLNNAKGITTNAGALPFFFFDTTVGTLNSIEFSASYGFQSAIVVSASTNSTGSAATESAARFSSDDAGVTAALNSAVNQIAAVKIGSSTLAPAAFDITGSQGTYNIVAGAMPLASSGNAGTGTITVTSAATLAAFSRVGTFSYNPLLTTLTGLVLEASGGNASATQTTVVTGQLSIVYNITPLATPPSGGGSTVPEPETWAMMLAGFGVIGATLRHRRRAPDGRVTPIA